MRVSRFAIHHPVLTVMVTLIAILLGGMSLADLPINLMPDITYPTLSIDTTYQNAGPEEIEELITRPLEEAVSSVPNVEEVSSVSIEGRSRIRVSFSWDTDLDAAANDLRDRLDRAIAHLPEEADRPGLRKFDLAGFPVLILGASSELDPTRMREIIDDEVKYRIERVSGVASLGVWGGLEREIHVELEADKIKALGLPLDGIVARLGAENVNIPAGATYRGDYEVTVRTLGSYENLEEIGDTVLASRGAKGLRGRAARVRLRDVARVRDTWRKQARYVRVNGKPSVRLGVFKQSGANTVEVARGALEELEKLKQDPDMAQIEFVVIRDLSEYIQRAIRNVGIAAVCGGALAVFILFFFLREVRSTAIIALAIPVSVVTTFALIRFGGFTLNIMTLGGLALGIGMLLDNSIVVLENIHRLRESGEDPFEAAARGTEEVSAAIVASTLTTTVVFLPLIFMAGMAGVMFKQLAYVVAFSLLCSLVVALTLVPMLAAHLSGAGRASPSLGRFQLGYVGLVGWALSNRLFTVLAAVVFFVGSLALVPRVGVEYMPAADEGEVRVYAEMEVGTRLEATDRMLRQVEAVVREAVPEAETVRASAGGAHWRASGAHTGDLRIALVPGSKRSRSSEEIADDLRRRLQGLPGVRIRTRAGQGLFLLRLGMASDDKVQVEVRGHDLETSDALAKQVEAAVRDVPGVTDARISRETGTREEIVKVDRDRAGDLKLSVSQVASTLETALAGTTAGYFREAGDEYPIVVKVRDAENLGLDEILELTVTNADGEPVVLRNVVTNEPRRGPVRIERKDRERVATISAEFTGRDMGSVIADIKAALRSVPVPPRFKIELGGDYEEQQEAFYGKRSRFFGLRLGGLRMSLILALALVYMVMAGLYESLRDPFVVMFSVPFAAVGVIVILLATGTTFNVQSFIGCIMLGGIVVNNAILLVDHTNLLRRRDGMPLAEAIREAGRRRLRPILMTAATTSLALVPLALGLGEGGEAQAPMARAVIGGLLTSTAITLVLVPVVYSILEKTARGVHPPAGPEPPGRGEGPVANIRAEEAGG